MRLTDEDGVCLCLGIPTHTVGDLELVVARVTISDANWQAKSMYLCNAKENAARWEGTGAANAARAGTRRASNVKRPILDVVGVKG